MACVAPLTPTSRETLRASYSTLQPVLDLHHHTTWQRTRRGEWYDCVVADARVPWLPVRVHRLTVTVACGLDVLAHVLTDTTLRRQHEHMCGTTTTLHEARLPSSHHDDNNDNSSGEAAQLLRVVRHKPRGWGAAARVFCLATATCVIDAHTRAWLHVPHPCVTRASASQTHTDNNDNNDDNDDRANDVLLLVRSSTSCAQAHLLLTSPSPQQQEQQEQEQTLTRDATVPRAASTATRQSRGDKAAADATTFGCVYAYGHVAWQLSGPRRAVRLHVYYAVDARACVSRWRVAAVTATQCHAINMLRELAMRVEHARAHCSRPPRVVAATTTATAALHDVVEPAPDTAAAAAAVASVITTCATMTKSDSYSEASERCDSSSRSHSSSSSSNGATCDNGSCLHMHELTDAHTSTDTTMTTTAEERAPTCNTGGDDNCEHSSDDDDAQSMQADDTNDAATRTRDDNNIDDDVVASCVACVRRRAAFARVTDDVLQRVTHLTHAHDWHTIDQPHDDDDNDDDMMVEQLTSAHDDDDNNNVGDARTTTTTLRVSCAVHCTLDTLREVLCSIADAPVLDRDLIYMTAYVPAHDDDNNNTDEQTTSCSKHDRAAASSLSRLPSPRVRCPCDMYADGDVLQLRQCLSRARSNDADDASSTSSSVSWDMVMITAGASVSPRASSAAGLCAADMQGDCYLWGGVDAARAVLPRSDVYGRARVHVFAFVGVAVPACACVIRVTHYAQLDFADVLASSPHVADTTSSKTTTTSLQQQPTLCDDSGQRCLDARRVQLIEWQTRHMLDHLARLRRLCESYASY